MEWLLWAGGAAGAAVAVLTFTKMVVALLAQAVDGVIQRRVGPDLSYIKAELSANSGTSVKDVVVRLDRWSAATDVRLGALEKFAEYQHQRNHDVLNHLTAIKGFMELDRYREKQDES